jgi:hypothetical protein
MKPADSPAAFASFVNSKGLSVSQCTPRQGVEQMFSFYRSVQPVGCGGPNGDMLLFQWGTYDWGAGRNFELNITRQFVEDDEQDDDAISQLSLTFRFEPTAERDALGDGNRWCDGPTEFDIVREFAMSSPSLLAVADERAVVVLSHSYV